MKLNDMGDALYEMRDVFDLDGTDLMLLSDFEHMQKQGHEATTIMSFIEGFNGASQATTHARIKKLCEKKFLKKVDVSDNLRYKTLEKGSEFNKLVKILEKL